MRMPSLRHSRRPVAGRAAPVSADAAPAALGCHIGFEEHPEVLERLSRRIDATWVDLDAVPADHLMAEEEQKSFFLLVRTPADLRRAVPYGNMLPAARAVTVIIAESLPWRPAPTPVPDGARFWRTLREVQVRRGRRRTRASRYAWRVDVSFGRPAPAGGVLRALARGMGGLSRETLHTPVVCLSGVGSGQWRPGDPNVTLGPVSGPVPERRDAPGCDLSLRTAVAASAGSPSSPDRLAPIDERSVCPIGFAPAADGPLGELVERPERYEVVQGDAVVIRVPRSGSLTDTDVLRLRGLAGVVVDLHDGWTAPSGAARIICGLAAAGVPVVAEPRAAWRDLLGAELAELLDGFTADRLADALLREEFSIRLRRCALTLHGVAGRWRGLAVANGVTPQAPPGVSVLLCTRRPDMVGFALEQVGRQRGPEVELILTLHGFPADHPDAASAISAYKGEIRVVEADSRTVFGEALNQAARHARCPYLTKMDDDDWYGPDHLSDLLLAQRYSAADLVGAAPEFVYLERIGVTVHRDLATETYAGVVAGGTMLMSRAVFDNAGGFRPIPRTVDGQLLEAVSAAGGRIYRTHGLNYILRRRDASGHTWQEPINAFLRSFRRQWRGLYANSLMEMEGLSMTGESYEA